MAKTYLTIKSPLDDSVKRECKFTIQHIIGSEGICENFYYSLRINSTERLTDAEIKTLIGGWLTVGIGYKDKKSNLCFRYINGIVFKLKELGASRAPLMPEIWRYQVDISSWLKTLDYTRECRIFQKGSNTSMRIISELLHECGCHDFKNEVKGILPQIEYTVIYNESISNFIRRLAQADGIIWRFEHEENKHILVFSDDSTSFPEIRSDATGKSDVIQSFCQTQNLIPVKDCTLSSYNWENQPVNHVLHTVNSAKGKLSHFKYVGGFPCRSEGETKARHHSMALEKGIHTYSGQSSWRASISGKRFVLSAPTLPDLNGNSYLITKLKIEATITNYSNEFVAIPSNQPFLLQADEALEIPKVLGTQTAIVVGEGGQGKVQTDHFGRVKVRFHWDHHSPQNANHTSAFIRISMPSAGARRGFVFVPRVDEEVVVDFEDGNPDKPIIIGCVYSKHSSPPIDPGAQPFTSIIRNGPHPDSNQILFDDKPNGENIQIVARKDMKMDISNDFNINVVNNISIKARYIIISARGEIRILAGKNIENMSLATIVNMAGAGCTNTAGNNITNFALNIISSQAGGAIMNASGVMIANTSTQGINQESDRMVANMSKMVLSNTGTTIVNAGTESIKTQSALTIINKASEMTVNETNKQNTDVSLVSTTETSGSLIKGDTAIGP